MVTKPLSFLLLGCILLSLATFASSQGQGMVSPTSTQATDALAASSLAEKAQSDSTKDSIDDKDADPDDDGIVYPTVEDVQLNSTLLDSPLVDIVWCGAHKENVIVLTEKGTIYRSDDGGMTWKKLRQVFTSMAEKGGTDADEAGDVDKILQSPVDKELMLFVGSSQTNWYTTNCAADIQLMQAGRNIKEFQFHPIERDWVLASTYTSCEDFASEDPCRIYKMLYVSQDLGKTWKFIADYVIQFSWAAQDFSFVLFVPKERVVIAHDLQKKGHQKMAGWSENAEIAYSDDFFKTKTEIVHRGNKFLITRSYFFAVQVDDEDSQDVRLLICNPRYGNYKFNNIQLPSKNKKSQLLEHSYTILDTTEGQVFLHINHEGEQSKTGNIYISDSTGTRFSISLRNNVRGLDGQCDFEKVQGLEGIYLANVYDSKMIKKLKNEFAGADEIRVEKSSTKPKSAGSYQTAKTESKYQGKRYGELENYKMTRISFDKGSIWQALNHPRLTARGDPVECEDEESCHLHLHSISNSRFGPFYSTESSLGIVIGTGNIGKYLSNREDEISTYLSRDGGLNWYEIKKGSHIYEIGDHGAIIVVAPDQKASKYVYYTWNEGRTWDRLKISQTAVQISNIIIEPTNTAEKFILYGRTTASKKSGVTEPKGIMVSIDFTSLHERSCEGADRPEDENSDYETWSPNGAISSHCLMGHQTTYVRRKRDALCYNNEEFDRWYSYKNCECTEEDWECDLGYERKDNTGPCILTVGEEPSYAPPEECFETYTVTKGYRKVAGNTCRGGVDHAGLQLPCPGSIVSKQNLIIGLALAVAAVAVYILSKRGGADKAKELMKGLGQTASQKAASLGQMGFKRMNQEEGADFPDDDDDFDSRLKFDDHEPTVELDERSTDKQKGKRMTERKGLETASKNIPVVSGPGKRNAQDDDDEDDIGGFDPRS